MTRIPSLGPFVRAIAFAIITLAMSPSAWAQYEVPAGFGNLSSVFIDPAVGSELDETNFLSAMNSFGPGGGIINMNAGFYKMSGISLSSNIHVRMQAGVIIEQDTATNIFVIGANNTEAVNVSIQGASPTSKAVMRAVVPPGGPDSTNFRAVNVSAAFNFKVSNLMIEEHDTRFSTIITGTDASQGSIEDITMTGAGHGWGLYQVQGGQDISVKNLDGTGGYTLRLEQGDAGLFIDNIVAENIISRVGRAGVLVAPKNPNSGTVEITKVRSYGSAWAVQAGDGKEGGAFESVTISDIEATYGSHGAQFKRWGNGHVRSDFLPESEKAGLVAYDPPDTKFWIGPSFGVAQMDTSVDWVTFLDVKDGFGFSAVYEFQPNVITQISNPLIRAQRLADPAIPVLPGDYNGNGTVDNDDLAVWQVAVDAGGLGTLPYNDFLGVPIGQEQFDVWEANFGLTVNSVQLLGDSNQDGVVDFSDIAPFIEILTNGMYLEAADCNQDGVVNFSDIAPFITILAGG